MSRAWFRICRLVAFAKENARDLSELIGHKVFGFYYVRLWYQAYWLYTQSELFKLRWHEMGLEFAEQSFANDHAGAKHFFLLAKKEHWRVRLELFLDGLLDREWNKHYVASET